MSKIQQIQQVCENFFQNLRQRLFIGIIRSAYGSKPTKYLKTNNVIDNTGRYDVVKENKDTSHDIIGKNLKGFDALN